ncbi:hypothetical protein ACIBG4_40910 [Nonomuraea sp. NPDC050383]|uniref:hypothetical protein n=1 Tax=Nonomuraea sp. NPDC050383 TaxID=3364362 RepID=UPI0037A5016C
MSTPTTTAAEQARALLAYAADGRHFSEHYQDNHRTLDKQDAATAMYAAQAATAHTLLAITDQLAALRHEVRQAAACRAELAQIATAVQYLAGANERSNARIEAALSGMTTSIEKTVSDGLDGIGDAIREHGETFDSAACDVIDVMDRPRWWQWRRRSQRQQAAIVEGDVR